MLCLPLLRGEEKKKKGARGAVSKRVKEHDIKKKKGEGASWVVCAIHNLPSTAKRKLVVLVELVAWGPYAKRSHCHTLIFFFGQSYIDIYILFFWSKLIFFLVEIKIDIYILQSVLLLSFFFWSTYCCYLFFCQHFCCLKRPTLIY